MQNTPTCNPSICRCITELGILLLNPFAAAANTASVCRVWGCTHWCTQSTGAKLLAAPTCFISAITRVTGSPTSPSIPSTLTPPAAPFRATLSALLVSPGIGSSMSLMWICPSACGVRSWHLTSCVGSRTGFFLLREAKLADSQWAIHAHPDEHSTLNSKEKLIHCLGFGFLGMQDRVFFGSHLAARHISTFQWCLCACPQMSQYIETDKSWFATISETNSIYVVIFGMQNRTSGLCSAGRRLSGVSHH
jgi:hypothetical protein